jgi:hypothetical protein
MKDIGKTWSLGGIPLVVEKDSEDYIKPRIAELGPLDATYNYIHFGGTEALKRDLTTVLFTGYKSYPGTSEGLYGLIGSGYHELVSDQGTEGNYWITEAKTDRLQDIHRNTGANYRITMKLIKETPIVKYVLVATKTDGLYITTSLTFDGWYLRN